jgi:hypothetical protein
VGKQYSNGVAQRQIHMQKDDTRDIVVQRNQDHSGTIMILSSSYSNQCIVASATFFDPRRLGRYGRDA